MIDETQQDVSIKKEFWTLPYFLLANLIVALFFAGSFFVVRVPIVRGELFGIALSGHAVLFFVMSLIWVVIITTYTQSLFRKLGWSEVLPIITGIGSWFVALILGWLLFVTMLDLYVIFR